MVSDILKMRKEMENLNNYIMYPLAELNQCIFNSPNRVVIHFVYILKDCKCTNFPDNSGKQPFSFFSIISNNHKLICQLGEYRFNSFPCFGIRDKLWLPTFLI